MSSCIDGYMTCVLRKEFAFDKVYSPTEPYWTPCVPLYDFNCAESIGNSLLTPLQWVLIELEEPDNLFVEATLRIAFLFALVVSAPGMFFKKFGELFNPYSELREQAITKLEEIRAMKTNYLVIEEEIPSLEHFEYSLIEEKILAKKADPKKRKEWEAQWRAAIYNFINALRSEEDPSSSEKEIRRLLNDEAEVLTKFTKFIDSAKKRIEYICVTRNILIAGKEYNDILTQISPTPISIDHYPS